MEYIVKCNKFPDTQFPETFDEKGKKLTDAYSVPSCRFYVLEQKDGKNTGKRWKVHVDGEVDFSKVKAEFKNLGQEVSLKELQEAYK